MASIVSCVMPGTEAPLMTIAIIASHNPALFIRFSLLTLDLWLSLVNDPGDSLKTMALLETKVTN